VRLQPAVGFDGVERHVSKCNGADWNFHAATASETSE
jgi:hypothetical protein